MHRMTGIDLHSTSSELLIESKSYLTNLNFMALKNVSIIHTVGGINSYRWRYNFCNAKVTLTKQQHMVASLVANSS